MHENNFRRFTWNNNYIHGLIVLQNLGQILPSKLEYLSLALEINISGFVIFLRDSQIAFIKEILIKKYQIWKPKWTRKKEYFTLYKEIHHEKKKSQVFDFFGLFLFSSLY
jgi:hypothetical protein